MPGLGCGREQDQTSGEPAAAVRSGAGPAAGGAAGSQGLASADERLAYEAHPRDFTVRAIPSACAVCATELPRKVALSQQVTVLLHQAAQRGGHRMAFHDLVAGFAGVGEAVLKAARIWLRKALICSSGALRPGTSPFCQRQEAICRNTDGSRAMIEIGTS
jgi:hypothetical protein